MSSIKGVIFDRDGTLIEHVAYLSDVKDIHILPTVIYALSLLKERGIQCFIATNQSGIGRGFYTDSQYKIIEEYLNRLFSEHGVGFSTTYYCPYHPEHGIGDYRQDSNDRKPNPGMILSVMSDYGLSNDELVMVGDSGVDIGAAQNANVRSVLVKTGLGQTFIDDPTVQPNYVADTLLDAVDGYILTI